MNYLIPTIFICLQVLSFGAPDKVDGPRSVYHLQNLDSEKSYDEAQSQDDLMDSISELDMVNPLSTVKIDYDHNTITLESRNSWTKDDEQKRALNKNLMRFGKRSSDMEPEDHEEETSRNHRPDFMRFGRANEFLRLGKRANDFMRFGRANEFMRLGKASAGNYMRFGRASGDKYMRFGRSSPNNYLDIPLSGEKVMRFGRADSSFMRLGRPDAFMRLGRSGSGGSDSDPNTEPKPEKPIES